MFDLIVALGGSDLRKQRAVELLKAGQGSHVLFTGDSNVGSEYQAWGVVTWGIAPSRVSKDTPDDMRVIQDTLQANRFTSCLIVDSGYHAPRSEMLAGRIIKPYYSVQFTTVPDRIPLVKRLSEIGAFIREFFTVYS